MIFIQLLLSFSLAASAPSAYRTPQSDYRVYFKRATSHRTDEGDSVLDRSQDILNEPWKNLKTISLTTTDLQKIFLSLKEHRPAQDKEARARRLPWQYPDDGCYARSAMMQSRLRASGIEGFQQIFIFGNLHAATPYHPSKQVSWWYHVAPIVKTPHGVYVIDPTMDTQGPLKVENWYRRMLHNSMDAKISLCDPASYSPESDCQAKTAIEVSSAIEEFREVYFELEWERVENLGRDPEAELGPFPSTHSNQLIFY